MITKKVQMWICPRGRDGKCNIIHHCPKEYEPHPLDAVCKTGTRFCPRCVPVPEGKGKARSGSAVPNFPYKLPVETILFGGPSTEEDK